MQALREITHVTGRQLVLTVPAALDNLDVEVIVLPIDAARHMPRKTPAAQRGCLKDYADPDRIAQEDSAWGASVRDEHGSRLIARC